MICSKCGKQIPDGQAICPYCQNNTVVNNVNMNANNIKPIKKKKPYKWIILIVAILLIIGVGVFAAIKIIPNIGLTTVTCTKTEPGDFDSDSYNFDKYQLVQTATYKDNEFLKHHLA